MSQIKWERLHPARKAIRTGFDSIYAEHNGAALCVTLNYYEDVAEVRKDAFDLRWSVKRVNSDRFEVLGASAFQVFSADVSDQELRKVFDLFKRRAEAIASNWVEE